MVKQFVPPNGDAANLPGPPVNVTTSPIANGCQPFPLPVARSTTGVMSPTPVESA
jgi:hypothetical protein